MSSASYPVSNADWIPTKDQKSTLGYQGSVTVPNACNGGLVRFNLGGTFSATILLR
jgi:hypothetical protein